MPRIAIVAIYLLFMPFLALAAEAEERPDFSGTWLLNEELSDDLEEKLAEMRSQAGRGGGARGGGRGRGGRGGGRGGGEDGQGRAAAIQRGAERLTITQQESSMSITDGSDRQRTVTLDGEPTAVPTPRGDEIEISAEWKRGDRLEWTIARPERPEVTELYELIAEGERLYVTVNFEGGDRRPALKFRRVYEREEEPVSAEEPDEP